MEVATSLAEEKRRYLDTGVVWQAIPHHDGVSELVPYMESTSHNRSIEPYLTLGWIWMKRTILAGKVRMSSTYSSGYCQDGELSSFIVIAETQNELKRK